MKAPLTIADEELVTLLIAGDRDAFAELYNRYFQLLYGFAYKRLRDKETARDIIQDFFARLWTHRESLHINTSTQGYFFTAVSRKIIDHFLHQNVEARYIASFNDFISTEEGHTDHPIREKQLLEMIEREIAALPPRMREVFELSRKSHLSHKAIAEQLNISEKTVTRQISNALTILRKRLGLVAWLLLMSRL